MIYVHVPFCRSFCTYCGFYSEAAPKCRREEEALKQGGKFRSFAQALEAEIRARKEDISRVFTSAGVNTLYIGGGTPSVLPLSVFGRIIEALRSVGHPCRFDEFTVEVNPEDIVEKGQEYVQRLMQLGVNRISMGVQSFDDGILKWMNRRHSAAQAVEAYHILEAAGIDDISIDLIFGLPQIDEPLWRRTIDKALNISADGVPPKHISAYQLSVEEDSMLEKLILKGRWNEASEQLCERQYEILCQALSAAGYNHYEISNFALPGHEAVHNSAYWRHVPYIGLGPGAHSYLAYDINCIRQWNRQDLNAYMTAGRTGDFSGVLDGEVLDKEQLIMERIMLGLRTAEGLPKDYLRQHCDPHALDAALANAALVPAGNSNLRIPESRFFVSDNIISSII